jgi:excinuclease ABC subunit A
VASGSLDKLLLQAGSITGECLRNKPLYPTRSTRRPVFLGEIPSEKSDDTEDSLLSRRLRKKSTRAESTPVDSGSAPASDSSILSDAPAQAYWVDTSEQLSKPREGASFEVSPAFILHDACLNNLKHLTVRFPENRFIAVTGVSGSGKSTLIRHCLLPTFQQALAARPRRAELERGDKATLPVATESLSTDAAPVGLGRITGIERFQYVHEVDQSPIGRTPRSTPATYIGFFDDIRKLFASAPAARMRGYAIGRFSFNSPAGRCPECDGTGSVKMEMSFLPTAHILCETCQGRRFDPETLDVLWNGKSIADILDMSVGEAIDFFANHPRILRPLEALKDTGLDYLRLGQTSSTLSGGEAQRIKLVTHLLSGLRPMDPRILPAGEKVKAKAKTKTKTKVSAKQAELDPVEAAPVLASKRSLFVLEEPTIGLHLRDVQRLVEVIQRLVDAGHTVIVIEHNLDLIAEADWVIDLGPEAGGGGGCLVAEGPPERISQNKESRTGPYLKPLLKRYMKA